ncbi:MAG: rhodanese-like domain-containing protein [Calditrichaeota bacterium]|nr:MAG: rhodanese-like domain-containing protein [Calditrichota bacterium]MBL1207216.1 rhodanese-like domain-containing protein [Calditrichota bacterium]NOG47049.1 rhodanese-like domain-containing protein [Calditrichota bacterium]
MNISKYSKSFLIVFIFSGVVVTSGQIRYANGKAECPVYEKEIALMTELSGESIIVSGRGNFYNDFENINLIEVIEPVEFTKNCPEKTQENTWTKNINSYFTVSPDELYEWMEIEDIFLINTHKPLAGNIVETDYTIAFDEIEMNLDKLPEDKNALVILYCRSGNMSRIAAQKLADLGYTNVYNLEGGMQEWVENGYSLNSK